MTSTGKIALGALDLLPPATSALLHNGSAETGFDLFSLSRQKQREKPSVLPLTITSQSHVCPANSGAYMKSES